MRLPIGKIIGWTLPIVMVGLLIGIVIVVPPGNQSGEAGGEIWTCSMHPQVRIPGPGPCPICGMKLIPLSQLKTQQKETEQRAAVETDKVAYLELFKEIRTVGKVDYNERRVKTIAARTAGRVDRVYADFTGIEVKQNDHLVDIYSPDLFSAQAELLRALEMFESAMGDRKFAQMSLDAARAKIRLLGILPEQIDELERSRKEQTLLTIYAPLGGTIVEKMVREGQYVAEGDPLYRIAELDPIWLYLDIYESDLGWVRYGQTVDVTVEAFPGEVFRGKVVFIDPFLNDQSRTVKVRVNLPNPERRLKPAMYASAAIRVRLRPGGGPESTGLEGKHFCPMHPEIIQDQPGVCSICEMQLVRIPGETTSQKSTGETSQDGGGAPVGKVLAIRASAVLDTGRRQITYRKTKAGALELVDLKFGPRAEIKDARGQSVGYYPVLGGLKAGDEVVIRGGFMLDSQRQIEGMPSLLYSEGQSAANLHAGHESLSPAPKSPPAAMPGHKH